MGADADSAVAAAQSALVRYCYDATAVVATEDDPTVADIDAQEILKQFQHQCKRTIQIQLREVLDRKGVKNR